MEAARKIGRQKQHNRQAEATHILCTISVICFKSFLVIFKAEFDSCRHFVKFGLALVFLWRYKSLHK